MTDEEEQQRTIDIAQAPLKSTEILERKMAAINRHRIGTPEKQERNTHMMNSEAAPKPARIVARNLE